MKNSKYTFCTEFNWGLNFYEDDFIIVMLRVLITQSVSAVFCPPVFFHRSASVTQHCELWDKWTKFNKPTCL